MANQRVKVGCRSLACRLIRIGERINRASQRPFPVVVCLGVCS
ncbi:hypothetical protein RBSH_00970 [Rhodopirellula baltica SH28]|uniref:Uncharacterized protein n=1 Tax=Rhodopirellula baltica SH28 TaxID=993517 RepID=K5ECB4_RHOBT|nr:hypothetical protein RBSH_00970 [Rhodopirellula baltica SH28]